VHIAVRVTQAGFVAPGRGRSELASLRDGQLALTLDGDRRLTASCVPAQPANTLSEETLWPEL